MNKKRSDIDFVAMAIVNHVCETHGISVEERQKHNDELMDYAYGKILHVDIKARTSVKAAFKRPKVAKPLGGTR